MPSTIGPAPDADRRVLRIAATLTAVIAAYGLVSRMWVMRVGLDRPRWQNIYFRLFALHELPHQLLLLAFALGMLWAATRSRRNADALAAVEGDGSPTLAQLWALALAVTALGVATTHLVMHDLLFSMDEFSVDFQARIFARGQTAATVPWPWRSIGPALTPIFVNFDPASGTWRSMYLPVYALLKAPFVALGAGTLLNPLLTGFTVVPLGLAARRIWPNEQLRPWVAVAFLTTSSEVIVTSGSGYTMPAHLLANVAWLWLALRGDRWSWAGALLVGALALGLHSPFPHALFVAPFLIRLLRERRWGRLGSALLVYGIASVCWLVFLRHARANVPWQANAPLLAVFAVPDLATVLLHGMNLSLLFTWTAPVLAILVAVVFLRLRHAPNVIIDLGAGVVLTLLFFMLFPSTQGHGWGYRYAFQVLGSLALIAADGAPRLTSALGSRSARHWLAGGIALALVQLPLRLVQTERFVRPFAAAGEYVRSRPEPIVIVRGDSVWYGVDLVRNDPYLARPIVLRRSALAPSAIEQIQRAFPGRVYEMSDAELFRLGMTALTRR